MSFGEQMYVQGETTEHVLKSNGGSSVYYYSNYFFFFNWHIPPRYFPFLAGEFSYVLHLDKSRGSENI